MTADSSTIPNIVWDDFAKIDLRLATVLDAKPHANADKLLILRCDLGNLGERQIVAGIRAFYDPATLVGKQILVVSNLEPRTLRGEISHGMVVAVKEGERLSLFTLDSSISMTPGLKAS